MCKNASEREVLLPIKWAANVVVLACNSERRSGRFDPTSDRKLPLLLGKNYPTYLLH